MYQKLVSVCRFAFVRFRTKEEVLQALWSLQDSDMQVFIPDEKGSSPAKTPFAALRNSPVKTTRTFVAKSSPEQRNPASSSQTHLSQVDKNLGTILLVTLPNCYYYYCVIPYQKIVGLFAMTSSDLF